MASSWHNERSSAIADDSEEPYFYTAAQVGIITVLFIASCLCVAVAVIIQVLFWKENRNSKILLCHSLCLMLFYTLITVKRFFAHPETNTKFCYFLFVTRYCSAWSAVLWISVMSYDVWSYLSEAQPSTPIRRCHGCHRNEHRFIYYSLVAWGLPLLSVATILIIDRDRRIQDALNLYPEIGTTCWFPAKQPSIWIFLHAPEIAVFVLNIIFFALTVATIRETRLSCANIANRDQGIQLFILYIKLFAIMGLCLPVATILFTVDDQTSYWFGYILDGLQGIAIFLVHLCRRTILEFIVQKFCASNST